MSDDAVVALSTQNRKKPQTGSRVDFAISWTKVSSSSKAKIQFESSKWDPRVIVEEISEKLAWLYPGPLWQKNHHKTYNGRTTLSALFSRISHSRRTNCRSVNTYMTQIWTLRSSHFAIGFTDRQIKLDGFKVQTQALLVFHPGLFNRNIQHTCYCLRDAFPYFD